MTWTVTRFHVINIIFLNSNASQKENKFEIKFDNLEKINKLREQARVR